MALLRLPPEILTHIFKQVGSSFFHQDLGRLTISKGWFAFALPACLESITLSQETLRRLIASGVTKRPHPLKNSLQTLDLDLRGYQSYIRALYSQEDADESPLRQDTASNESSKRNSAEAYIKGLNSDLSELISIAHQAGRLRTLRIQAWRSLDSPVGYLSLPLMRDFISMDNLSVLVLDISTSFLDALREQGECCHICPAIGSLLRTLRTLHLRMCRICPDVLKPRDPIESLLLNSVVINLSLTANLPGGTSAAHSKPCDDESGGIFQLKADLQEQAETLAIRMASPKTVRILSHSLPQFKIQSLDVLSGKTTILGDDMAWDEDGETVEEASEPESEITDDDSSFWDN